MNEWYGAFAGLSPWYCTALTALLLCVGLLLNLRRQLGAAEARLNQAREKSSEETAALRDRLERLDARLRELERETGVLVPPQPPRSGLNLSNRSEAMRLMRKGEPAAAIAAALALPLAEVELLGKVQKMLGGADRGEQAPRSANGFTAGPQGKDAQPSGQAEPAGAAAPARP